LAHELVSAVGDPGQERPWVCLAESQGRRRRHVAPQTAVTQTTLLLVAFDGEWTRRVVPSPEWAHAFAESLQIPGYDAAVVGYPQRMRDYNTRNKKHPDLR